MRGISLAALSIMLAGTAGAQDAPPGPPLNGWFTGASIGLPGFPEQSDWRMFTTGISVLQLRPRGASGDVWIGTIPRAMATGVPVVAGRANLGYAIATSRDFAILPTAGVSGVSVVGAGRVGWNAGMSGLLVLSGVGLRGGATAHFFSQVDAPVWLLEIGFVDLPAGYWFVPRRLRR